MEFKEPIDQQLLVDSDLIMEPCHVCRCCESDAIPESRLIWGQQHRAVSGTSRLSIETTVWCHEGVISHNLLDYRCGRFPPKFQNAAEISQVGNR